MTNKWVTKKLDEVATVTMGQSPSSSSYNTNGEGVPFLQGMPPVVDSMGAAVPKQWTTEPTKVVEAGTALITVRAPVGELFTTNNSVCLGRGLAGIKANSDISQTYLNYYLQFSKKQFYTLSQGSTFTAINSGDLKGIQVNLPSFEQQEYVGKVLGTIDQDISKTGLIIKKTELFNRGVITQLLDNSSIHIVKLNTVCSKITDGTHLTPKYLPDGVPFLRINDIQSNQVDWTNCKHISVEEHKELIKRCKPEKGDVLLSKNGTIGITKVIDWDKEFSIFVSLCLIKPDTSKVLPEYLTEVVGSEYVMNQVRKRSKQGTVTNLHLEEIRDFDIPLPDMNRQKKIVSIMKDLKLGKMKEEVIYQSLTRLKKGMMQDIFSQKVEVQ